MNSDITGEVERIAAQRDQRNNDVEEERLELLEIRDRLDGLVERTGEDDAKFLWTSARMLGNQILKRCPHDPDEYEVIKIDCWDWCDPPYVSAEVRCLHCDAEGSVNDPTIVNRLRRLVAAD